MPQCVTAVATGQIPVVLLVVTTAPPFTQMETPAPVTRAMTLFRAPWPAVALLPFVAVTEFEANNGAVPSAPDLRATGPSDAIRWPLPTGGVPLYDMNIE